MIVVIGVLSAGSVVAYRGIQERAIYAKLYAGLNAYEKAFKLYRADHGEYPHTDGYRYSCLGRPEDYPATEDFQEGQCGFSDSTYPDLINDEVNINIPLKPYLSTIPDFSGLPVVEYDGKYTKGMKTRGVYYEGNEGYYYYEYGMKNNQECLYGRNTWGDETLCNRVVR